MGRRQRRRAASWRLVHAGGGAEHAGADVGDVGEFEEALDGAVFAEGAVEDGEDDVQRPVFEMPIGATSNFLRSIALRIEAAERSETSCSPLRPPKRMPTRSFFAMPLRLYGVLKMNRDHPQCELPVALMVPRN
jgi:hypothetical protein